MPDTPRKTGKDREFSITCENPKHDHPTQRPIGAIIIPPCCVKCPLCSYAPDRSKNNTVASTIRKHVINSHTPSGQSKSGILFLGLSGVRPGSESKNFFKDMFEESSESSEASDKAKTKVSKQSHPQASEKKAKKPEASEEEQEVSESLIENAETPSSITTTD